MASILFFLSLSPLRVHCSGWPQSPRSLAVGRLVSLHPSRAFVVADDCNILCLLTWLAVIFTHNIKEGKLVSTDETREALLRSDG